MAHQMPELTTLKQLCNEVYGELLDDCGDWDAKVSAQHIIDCVINNDWLWENATEDAMRKDGVSTWTDDITMQLIAYCWAALNTY